MDDQIQQIKTDDSIDTEIIADQTLTQVGWDVEFRIVVILRYATAPKRFGGPNDGDHFPAYHSMMPREMAPTNYCGYVKLPEEWRNRIEDQDDYHLNRNLSEEVTYRDGLWVGFDTAHGDTMCVDENGERLRGHKMRFGDTGSFRYYASPRSMRERTKSFAFSLYRYLAE